MSLNNENSTTKPVLLLHYPTNAKDNLFHVPPTFGTGKKWPCLAFVSIKGYWEVKIEE